MASKTSNNHSISTSMKCIFLLWFSIDQFHKLISNLICGVWVVFFFFLQSGCCKPPTDCNFTYQSATNWTKLADSTISADQDCTTWSNDPNSLCYDCQSCKAGVLANLKKDWKKVAVVNIIFLIFLIIVYSIGCCAFRNNREDNSYPRWKGYP